MPTRSPHDRSAPIRTKVKSASKGEVHEAIWSFGGDITPELLSDAGASPDWAPFYIGGTGNVAVIKFGVFMHTASFSSGEGPTVRLFADGAQIAMVTLTSSGAWTTVNVDSTATRFYITASSTGAADDNLGHGLTAIMWYRYTSPSIEV